jgi:hypothetical protein
MISDMLKCLTKEKVQLPIHYNEPLSMLQKQCEKFMYAKLLDKAATTEDPYLKLAYISGFILSEVNCNINRILKPFNPILGETFEFIDNDLKYRFFSEQVSHNPPISAFICESDNYVFFGDTRSKSKFNLFKGNMEFNFLNKYNFIIKSTNEHFVFNKPTAFMRGLVFGNLHYDFKGLVNINNITNNKASATLEFFEEGKKQKTPGYVEGKILDENKEIKYLIKGTWDSNLYITDKDGKNKIDIWECDKEEFLSNTDFINNYLISSYCCKFNYLGENKKNAKNSQDNLENILPPTDSRFRKDQKLVEERKLEIADKEKERLENLQRKRHKKFEEEKIKYSPNYFSEVFDEKTNEYIYLFNGQYWEDRRDGKFEKLYDIFDNKNTISDI